MNRFFLILLISVSLPAHAAELFWVLGSYVEQAAARDEGKRISNESGIEVLLYESIVKGAVQYRLLTGLMSDESDQAGLRFQLQKVGIHDPWTLRFDQYTPYMETVFADIMLDSEFDEAELAEIDALLGAFDDDLDEFDEYYIDDFDDFAASDELLEVSDWESMSRAGSYVVAGSFRESGRARELAQRLGSLEIAVNVEPTTVQGTNYHRVLLGSVSPGEEAGLIDRLQQLGIEGAWVLKGVAAYQTSQPGSPASQEISQPQRGRSSTVQGRQTVARNPGDDSDFNLARLKKKRLVWPDPR